MMREVKTFEHLFDVGHDAMLRGKFASGHGVIELQPGMNDAMRLSVIKHAVTISDSKPFLVVTAAS